MRIKAKAFVSTLIISFLAMTPVLASPSVNIEKNYSNGEIKLNLNEEESRHYAVIMLKGATKPQELFGKIESGNIVTEGNITRYNPMSFLKYQNEFESNNGPVIEVTESGNYTIYISSKNNDEIIEEVIETPTIKNDIKQEDSSNINIGTILGLGAATATVGVINSKIKEKKDENRSKS